MALLFLLPALMGTGVVQREQSSESEQYFLLSLSLLLVVPGLQSPRPSRSKVSILFPQGSDSKYFRLCGPQGLSQLLDSAAVTQKQL